MLILPFHKQKRNTRNVIFKGVHLNGRKTKPQRTVKKITDSIETGIMELFESDKYKSYLQIMNRYHKYSLNNTLLISMIKPDTILVTGFNKWQDGFSRFVKKDEKGIKIITHTVKNQRGTRTA